MRSARLAHRSPNRRDVAVAPKIRTAIATNTLRFRCPDSGRVVDTGISTQYSTRLISIRVRCPICENLHEWLVVGESLGVVSSGDHADDGRLVVEAQSLRHDSNELSSEIIKLREQLLDELESQAQEQPANTHGPPSNCVAQSWQQGSSRRATRHAAACRCDENRTTNFLLRPQFDRCQQPKLPRSCLCQRQSLLC